MRFCGLTNIGRVRETNEDFISIPNENEGMKLFILADRNGWSKWWRKS